MKNLLKNTLYLTGMASLFHQRRNRNHLTTVMFHRVLPEEDPRHRGANPTYTVTPDEFEICMQMFKRHYSIVSLEQIEEMRCGKALPPCPLLITFDDGWQDNHQYALPLLKKHGLPAVLFVAAGFVGSDQGFWQEELLDRFLTGSLTDADLEKLPAKGLDGCITALAGMAAADRDPILDSLSQRTPALPRRMASEAELRNMAGAGIAIGGHGYSHDPMTSVAAPDQEAAQCQAALQEVTGLDWIESFSFPHGRYDEKILEQTQAAGFRHCFTSDPFLQPVGTADPMGPIGRIEIDLTHWRRNNGSLDRAGLAFFLFTQARKDS